jgi:predicted component of type VI protein secretion system
MAFNPLKFLTGKIVRPVLRKLAGEAGEQLRQERELRRKVAAATVAVARRQSAAAAVSPLAQAIDNSVTAWQAVTRGRTIKGRGIR